MTRRQTPCAQQLASLLKARCAESCIKQSLARSKIARLFVTDAHRGCIDNERINGRRMMRSS
jgi:hypothetical protein